MTASRPDPVLIAGGGIGGLAASLALARAGIPSLIAERRLARSEAGAGIQLSPNGMHVLERLGIAPLLAPHAGVPREIVVREARSALVLQRLPLGAWIAERHGAPYWQVHRRDLQSALVARAEAEPLITVEHGLELASFAADGDGVRLVARDGRHLRGSLLLGADGIFSRVRQQSFAPRAPRFTGWAAARAVIEAPTGASPDGPISAAAAGVWLAPGAHVVHYPVRGGREIAFVVVRAESSAAEGWSQPVAAAEVEGALAAAAPHLAAALGTGHEWRRWALYELEPLDRWVTDRVALLGDAAHPTLPFLAQGGSLALEDAWTLAHCLSGVSRDPARFPAALQAYQGLRAQRARRVVAAARRNGKIFHLAGLLAGARNAAMRALSGERVMAGFDWVYGWKPD